MYGLGQKQVKEEFQERFDEIEKEASGVIPDERKKDLADIARENLDIIARGNSNVSNRGQFFDFFEKLYKYGISIDLERKAQHLDRFTDLMLFFRRFHRDYKRLQAGQKASLDAKLEELETKLVYCLRYFQWRGTLDDLEYLHDITTKADDAIKTEALEAQRRIIERSLPDVLDFFGFDWAELIRVIEEMISNKPNNGFGKLPGPFVPHSFSQAILQLRKIRKMAKDLLIDEDIEDWLKTPQKSLSGKSARDAVIAGKGFRVLQILIRFGEGIF